jgi:hypothetical protein
MTLINKSFNEIRPLLLASLISLLMHGASSNHVMLEIIVCASLLVSNDVVSSVRYLMFALYLTTAIDKLNEGWGNTRHSCSSLMTIGALATLGIPDILHLSSLAPTAATITEFVLAALSLSSPTLLMALGACFHCFLALPDSPMSVYPFSVLMLPLYALAAPDAVLAARVPAAVPAAAAAAAAWLAHANRNPDRFEYPDYGLWPAGLTLNLVAWAVCLWAALNPAAAAAAGGDDDGGDTKPARRGGARGAAAGVALGPAARWRGAWVGAAMVAGLGACPYLGLRTHPAFAMFSNLRTEVRRRLGCDDAGESDDMTQMR